MSAAELVVDTPTWRLRLRKQIGAAVDDWSDDQAVRCESIITEAKAVSDLQLECWAETVAYHVADSNGDAFRLATFEPQAAAIAYVLRSRAEMRRTGFVSLPKRSSQYEATRKLIAEVKANIRIVDFLEAETPWKIIYGKRESHSPCPVCNNGRDRFVITHSDPELAWCRQCRWGGDVIGVAGATWGMRDDSADGLREIVTRLAQQFLMTTAVAS